MLETLIFSIIEYASTAPCLAFKRDLQMPSGFPVSMISSALPCWPFGVVKVTLMLFSFMINQGIAISEGSAPYVGIGINTRFIANRI